MSIYTRRGDTGDTSLADGTRVPKDAARVEAYGALDELGSAIGLARAAVTDPKLDEVLGFVQHRLFVCAGCVATPPEGRGSLALDDADTHVLERAIDRFESETGPLRGFILAGGGEAGARLQLARAIARRAERRLVALNREEPLDAVLMAFVNRASDLLFAAARYANLLDGIAEELWDRDAARPEL